MNSSDSERKKRTQRDYTLGFKLAVVSQIEKIMFLGLGFVKPTGKDGAPYHNHCQKANDKFR